MKKIWINKDVFSSGYAIFLTEEDAMEDYECDPLYTITCESNIPDDEYDRLINSINRGDKEWIREIVDSLVYGKIV